MATEREIRLKNEAYRAKFGQKQPAKTKSVVEKRIKESETKTAKYTKIMALAFVGLLMAGFFLEFIKLFAKLF